MHISLHVLTLCFIVAEAASTRLNKPKLKEKEFPHHQLETSPFIIGGDKVSRYEYPWFVSADGCGGSLVSSQFILTAAHCAQPFEYNTLTVGKLCNSSGNCGQYSENVSFKDIFIHPDFDEYTLSHDFALIKIQEKSNINPVAIDLDKISLDYPNDKELWATGFGDTSPGDDMTSIPDHLLHSSLLYMKNGKCQWFWDQHEWQPSIDTSMMCAKKYERGTCYGDSGGPLYDKEAEILVGITSWGSGSCIWSDPPVFARIADEIEWIHDIICENSSYDTRPEFCPESFAPSASPTAYNVPDPSDFLFLVSANEAEGKKWCIQPESSAMDARIVVKECDNTDMQKWAVDDYGRLHWWLQTNWCIMRIQSQMTLKMADCLSTKSPLRQFMHNDFENTIVWKKYGTKTFTIKGDIPKDSQRVELYDRDLNLSTQRWFIQKGELVE